MDTLEYWTREREEIAAVVKTFSHVWKSMEWGDALKAEIGLPLMLAEDEDASDVPQIKNPGRLLRPDGPVPINKATLRYFGDLARAAYGFPGISPAITDFGEVLHSRPDLNVFIPDYNIVVPKSDCPYLYPASSNVLLVIRGTMSLADVLTDLAATKVPWRGTRTDVGDVHHGFMNAAQSVLDDAYDRYLASYDHITVVGHSLGAGVATYVSMLLRERGKSTFCWAFAPPPSLERKTAAEEPDLISVVHRGDAVPRFTALSFEILLDRAAEKGDLGKGVFRDAANLFFPGSPTKKQNLTKKPVFRDERHFVGGRVLLKIGNEFEEMSPEEPLLPRLLATRTMITDHFPLNYLFEP